MKSTARNGCSTSATKIDVAFIRGTRADPSGNISMEKEALVLDNLAQAMAARNNGGIVIAQVERIVEQGSIKPKDVEVPGILVDCVVVAGTPELHRMNYGVMYNPALAGEIRVPVEGMAKMPLDERKIIARRAAFELPPNGVVNLGVGAPEGIAAVANEEKFTPYITLTTEAGAIGGVLASGSSFGGAHQCRQHYPAKSAIRFLRWRRTRHDLPRHGRMRRAGQCQHQQIRGPSQWLRRLHQYQPECPQRRLRRNLYRRRAETVIEDGKVRIIKEGRNKKFLNFVEQITFSGRYAQKRKQPVLYVTERCVFQLKEKGLELVEVAPGIDIDRDILAHMAFRPIINEPELMDQRLFVDEPMGLFAELLNLNMSQRVTFDPQRNILFVNLEGWHARSKKDIDELRKTLVEACQKVGKRVNSVVNHDGSKIAEALYDDYAEMIQYMLEHYYLTTARYATSAFARLKMKEAISKRGIRPHVFERKEAAQAFLEVVGE